MTIRWRELFKVEVLLNSRNEVNLKKISNSCNLYVASKSSLVNLKDLFGQESCDFKIGNTIISSVRFYLYMKNNAILKHAIIAESNVIDLHHEFISRFLVDPRKIKEVKEYRSLDFEQNFKLYDKNTQKEILSVILDSIDSE